MLIYEAEQPCGIAFEGERSPLIFDCASRLRELGFLRVPRLSLTDLADADFFAALNAFRRSENLPECDFLDPNSARLLTDRELSGDALILLAACSEVAKTPPTELERLDFCRRVLDVSDSLGITPIGYLSARFELSTLPTPSSDSVKCALLAELLCVR